MPAGTLPFAWFAVGDAALGGVTVAVFVELVAVEFDRQASSIDMPSTTAMNLMKLAL